jgi:hypothetical protein
MVNKIILRRLEALEKKKQARQETLVLTCDIFGNGLVGAIVTRHPDGSVSTVEFPEPIPLEELR